MDFIKKYLDYTREFESPTSFHEASALMALAGAVERKVWFDHGVGDLYSNLYILLIGPPASRKSTAALMATDILEEVEGVVLAPDSITKEAMYEDMELSGIKEEPRIIVKGLPYRHTSYTVVATEWGTFLPEKDMPFVLTLIKLYDCERRFRYVTKKSGRNYLPNVFFNMLGCIQPRKLADVLPKSAIGSGFTSRIIMVVENGPRHDNDFPHKDMKLRDDLIEHLREISNICGPITWTDDAALWYRDWYRNKRNNTFLVHDERFAHYIHRKPQHLLKIAMLMRISKDYESKVIEVEDLNRSLRWLNKIEANMTDAYGSFGMSRDVEATDLVRRFVMKKGQTTSQEILRLYYRDITEQTLRGVIDTLVGGGLIQKKTLAGGIIELKWRGEK